MIRAELIGLVTTTATKVTAVASVVGLIFTQLAFVLLLPALHRGDIGPGAEELGDDLPIAELDTAAGQLGALSPLGAATGGSIGISLLAVALLGVLAGTSDFRYGGIVGAALAQPRRKRILLAKAGATGLVALAVGAGLVVVNVAILFSTLGVAGTPLVADATDVVAVLARGTLAVLCMALIGLAIGVLARSQLAGVLVMLAILVAEPVIAAAAQLVTGSLPAWTQFLPVAVIQAAIGDRAAGLPPLVAVAAMFALTAAALVAASVALRRRDL